MKQATKHGRINAANFGLLQSNKLTHEDSQTTCLNTRSC